MFSGQVYCPASQKMPNSYRIFTDKHYAYFVTWTLVGGLPLFAEAAYRQIVLDSLQYLRTSKHSQLNAFVVMPTHLHAVLWPEDGVNLSDVTRDFKRYTSREISREAEQCGAKEFLSAFRKARKENRAQKASTYQVWQEGSHPEAIFTEKFARQKIDYIHRNPVRAGLSRCSEFLSYFGEFGLSLIDKETKPHGSFQIDITCLYTAA